MKENEKLTNQPDESKERHREMTEERKNKRNKILKGIAIAGAGAAIGAGGIAGYMMWLNNNAPGYIDYMILGGAMGQWEEVPMPTEESVAKFNEVCEKMRIS